MHPHPHPEPIVPSLPAATLAEAYAAVESEILAVPDDQLIRITVDVPRAAQVAFGAAERIDGLLPLLEQLSFYDPAPARKLRIYTAAALHAHLVAASLRPGRDERLTALVEEGRQLRANLLAGAESLAHFGLLSAQRIAAIRAGSGNLDMAGALSALSVLLGEAWAEIEDNVPITRAMVIRAGELGFELQAALGVRRIQRGTTPNAEARRIRAQAFALFARAYGACRRGVTFLRWDEGDVDWYVPSLHVRCSFKRSRRALARPRPAMPDARSETSTALEAAE